MAGFEATGKEKRKKIGSALADFEQCDLGPDGATCTKNCCVDGADYAGTYGATTSGNALSLKFLQKGSSGTNIGSRFYLMASETKYQMFTLLGNEFTFDVDASKLPYVLTGFLVPSYLMAKSLLRRDVF